MYYSQIFVTRKGPLSKVWLAAHFEKKLSKSQIFSTNITESVDTMLDSSADLALRVSGHLMLGIVRIYSKKMKYLMVDCTEAMWKIKLAFKPGNVDMDLTLQGNVDDLRHYGNNTMDDGNDFPLLDNIRFAPALLPMLTISRLGYLEEDSFISELNSVSNLESLTQQSVSVGPMTHSFRDSLSIMRGGDVHGLSRGLGMAMGDENEIELARAAGSQTPSALLLGPRTPLSIDPLQTLPNQTGAQTPLSQGRAHSTLPRFDDDLPGFDDEEIVVNFSQDKSLSHLHGLSEFNTYDADDVDMNQDTYMDEPAAEEPESLGVVTKTKKSTVQKSRPKSKPKKIVQIDTRIELADKVYRERVRDVTVGLRDKATISVQQQRAEKQSETALLRCDQYFGNQSMCDDLLDVYRATTNAKALPFPAKRMRVDEQHRSPSAVGTIDDRTHNDLSIELPRNVPMGFDMDARRQSEISNIAVDDMAVNMDMDDDVHFDDDKPFDVSFGDGFAPSFEPAGTSLSPQNGQSPSSPLKYISDAKLVLEQQLAKGSVDTSKLLKNRNRKFAAQCFVELLQLKAKGMVNLQQSQPFGRLLATTI